MGAAQGQRIRHRRHAEREWGPSEGGCTSGVMRRPAATLAARGWRGGRGEWLVTGQRSPDLPVLPIGAALQLGMPASLSLVAPPTTTTSSNQ